MTHSVYHSFLKVGALSVAMVLVFDSGLLTGYTKQLSQHTQLYLANTIGVSAGVSPTELNQYTAELTKKETELNAREAALTEREIAVNLSTESETGNGSNLSTYILSTILFILLVLIVLNYILDFIRQRKEQTYEGPTAVAS